MIMYYESDIDLVGGKVYVKKRMLSIGGISWCKGRIVMDGICLPVYLRKYRSGYGVVTGIAARDDDEYERALDAKDDIDEYMDVCRTFDANYLHTNEIHRLGISVRGLRYAILLDFAAIIAWVQVFFRSAINPMLFILIGSVLAFLSAYVMAITERKKRNCHVDQRFVDDLVKNGKCLGESSDGRGTVYVSKGTNFFRFLKEG